jgi:hypothetical protein
MTDWKKKCIFLNPVQVFFEKISGIEKYIGHFPSAHFSLSDVKSGLIIYDKGEYHKDYFKFDKDKLTLQLVRNSGRPLRYYYKNYSSRFRKYNAIFENSYTQFIWKNTEFCCKDSVHINIFYKKEFYLLNNLYGFNLQHIDDDYLYFLKNTNDGFEISVFGSCWNYRRFHHLTHNQKMHSIFLYWILRKICPDIPKHLIYHMFSYF